MQSIFEVTVSRLPGDEGEAFEPLLLSRILVAALVLTAAACAAALLVQ